MENEREKKLSSKSSFRKKKKQKNNPRIKMLYVTTPLHVYSLIYQVEMKLPLDQS